MAAGAYAATSEELSGLFQLPNRHLQVLGLICNADTNSVIAEKLGVSQRTVENYINNIFDNIFAELNIGSDKFNPRVMAAVLYRRAFPYEFAFQDLKIEPLAPHEYEILELIAQGDSNGVIAGRLVMKARIVESQVTVIYSKLQAAYDANGHCATGSIDKRVMAMLVFDKVPKPSSGNSR